MTTLATIAVLSALTAAPAQYQAVLDERRAAQNIAGASAVIVRRGLVVFAGGSGVADLESTDPITADTPFYIGSLSKVLTAVLALSLVEDEQLSLADAVDGIATDDAAPVRVAHLLTHASGLQREGDFDYWYTAEFPDGPALDGYLRETSLRAPPGTGIHYSNVGYAALGRVIETAADLPYAEVLNRRLTGPLGMEKTGAPGPIEGVANGYSPPEGVLPNAARPFAGVGEKIGDRYVRMYHDAGAMSPAFGIYSTAADMGRLARFLLGHEGGEILSEKMRHRMRERQPSGWGLGLKIQRLDGRNVARHDGWFAAHRSHLLIDAEEDVAVVVLTNGDNASPKSIAEALLAAVSRTKTIAARESSNAKR